MFQHPELLPGKLEREPEPPFHLMTPKLLPGELEREPEPPFHLMPPELPSCRDCPQRYSKPPRRLDKRTARRRYPDLGQGPWLKLVLLVSPSPT